jgi:hypothetical protein
MARTWPLPLDLDKPQDRQVAAWIAAQSNPTNAVKKLILDAAEGKCSSNGQLDLVPIILRELRALRAEVDQNHTGEQLEETQAKVFRELRALRADLSRVGPQELGEVSPPPEEPDSTRRLDTLFSQKT